MVIIGIPEHALLKSSFLIYLLPLLGLILGAMVGVRVYDSTGWLGRDALSIIFGMTGLAAVFLFLRTCIPTRTGKKDWQPVILRLVPRYPFENIVES